MGLTVGCNSLTHSMLFKKRLVLLKPCRISNTYIVSAKDPLLLCQFGSAVGLAVSKPQFIIWDWVQEISLIIILIRLLHSISVLLPLLLFKLSSLLVIVFFSYCLCHYHLVSIIMPLSLSFSQCHYQSYDTFFLVPLDNGPSLHGGGQWGHLHFCCGWNRKRQIPSKT